MSMSSIAKNLVAYRMQKDKEGKEYEILTINTTLLTKIRWSEGWRYSKQDTIRRRLRKKWKEAYPILSKFYTPVRYWECDFGDFDRWSKPKITIEYLDEDVMRIYFKSNELAEQAKHLMVKHFWGIDEKSH